MTMEKYISPRILMIRVKICCIASVAEAWTAIRAGASALGLVSTMPSGPGVIPWERIEEIAAAVPPPIATFLLTCSQNAAEIVEQQRRCRTNTIQICDHLTAGTYDEIRRGTPGIAIVQVIHVTGEESVDEAGDLAREGAGHRDQAAFCRGVIRLPDHTVQSRQRRHVDDRAAALIHHRREHRFRQRERAAEVRRDDVVPLLVRHVIRQRVAAD